MKIALCTLGIFPALAVAQECGWDEQHPVHVPDHSFGAMIFDSGRGVAVLETDQLPCFVEVSEWENKNWVVKNQEGPECRAGEGLVYDSLRGVSVLFGGSSQGADQNDTWEWNGQAWKFRDNVGIKPHRRRDHAMAFDSTRGVTVVFGGFYDNGQDDIYLGDTWEWNGASWIKAADTGPGASAVNAMAFDPERAVTVLYGTAPNGDETWEWDGKAWAQRGTGGPLGPRSGAAMVYDAALHACVLFGGHKGFEGNNVQNDLWAWDGQAWIQIDTPNPPPARMDHAMAYDSARDAIVLFGGTGAFGNILDDTWEFTCTPFCYPDFDGNGTLDLFDFLAFVNAFNAATPKADCDGDGTFTLFDFLCFTNAFNGGC